MQVILNYFVEIVTYSGYTYIFSDIINTLTSSGKVNGIILQVANDTELPAHMSPDQACPNVGSGELNFFSTTTLNLLSLVKSMTGMRNLIACIVYMITYVLLCSVTVIL